MSAKPSLTGKTVELRGEIILYNDKKLGIQIPEIVFRGEVR